MVQISENAGKLISKMTLKHGLSEGGLRIGIKAGGCSGLSYTFAWEPAARDGRSRVRGPGRVEGLRRSEEFPLHRRHDARLRHEPREQGIHFQQPERQEHLRLRDVVLVCSSQLSASSFQQRLLERWLEAGSWRAGSFQMTTATETIEQLANREYKYGFVTDVEARRSRRGSARTSSGSSPRRRGSRSGCCEWRLKAYRLWLTMKEPTWQNVKYDPINYQDIVYYSAPKKKKALNSLDEVDPEVRATFDKLGIPIEEQKMLCRRRRRRRLRQRVGGDDVPREAGERRDHLHARSRKRCVSIPSS